MKGPPSCAAVRRGKRQDIWLGSGVVGGPGGRGRGARGGGRGASWGGVGGRGRPLWQAEVPPGPDAPSAPGHLSARGGSK